MTPLSTLAGLLAQDDALPPKSVRRLRLAYRSLEAHLGRPPVATDLNSEIISQVVDSSDVSAATKKDRRKHLLRLWRYAWDHELTDHAPPKTVRGPAPRPVRVAWEPVAHVPQPDLEPQQQLSLEEVWWHVRRYLTDNAARLSDHHQRGTVYRVRAWLKMTPRRIWSGREFNAFRIAALKHGHKPRYIESIVTSVRLVAQHAEVIATPGKRLILPQPDPDVPRAARIGALDAAAEVAIWPRWLERQDRATWWRAFIVVASWTGLRLGDLSQLPWSAFTDDRLTWRANKTGKRGRPRLCMPLCPSVLRHLAELRAVTPNLSAKSPNRRLVFGLTKNPYQLRRELKGLAKGAGQQYIPPHGFRRFAINAWAKAAPQAGLLVQGSGLGAMHHYLDVYEFLASVAQNVKLPAEFMTEDEKTSVVNAEQSLLTRYRAAKAEDKALIDMVLQRIG